MKLTKITKLLLPILICSFPFLLTFFTFYYKQKLPGTTLFVTAHPDDEFMFFGPLLLNSENPFVLSLSKGLSGNNFDQDQRVLELNNGCQKIGLKNHCFVDESNKLKDGFNETWKPEIIKEIVINYCKKIKPDRIITFDNKGVSGHPNHISVSRGILQNKEEIKEYLENEKEIKELKTGFWITKYFGPISLFVECIINLFSPNKRKSFFIIPIEHFINGTLFQAYYEHKSQITWYRNLYLIFSKFQYYNIYH